MRGLKPFKLGFLTRPFSWGAQHNLGVSVFAFFSFTPHGQLFTDIEMWEVVAKELGSTPLEMGIPKSRAEFFVVGRCVQPGRRARPTCPVSARVGKLEKTLYVIGDRSWERGVPSEPRPFVEMPVDWAHAFGGKGFERNPLGKGAASITDAEGREVHPLPNVESPGHLLRSPKDRPDPVSFAPVDYSWPQRASMAGTYDAAWLKTRYPGFAADLDWRIWNAAPPDQQQKSFWQGNESFDVANMHPEKTMVEGRLPDLKARAFVTKRTSEDFPEPRFTEVELRLTTVWLFPHLERGIVVFQGATNVLEDDAADVDAIMVAAELLGAPRTLEHYEHVLARRTGEEAKENPAIHLADDELMPEGQSGFSPETEKQLALLTNEGLQAKRARARMEREVLNARTRLVEMDLDPDVHGPPDLDPEAEAPGPPNVSEMADRFAELMAQLEVQKAEAKERREKEVARVAELYAGLGLDFDEVRAEMAHVPTGPPQFSALAVRAKMREAADDAAALGHPLEELEFYASDPGWFEHMKQQEAQMVEAYRLSAHHQSPAPRLDEDAARMVREDLEDAIASGVSLAGRDLTGIDLSRGDLSRADLRNALLESANLERADLREAKLSGAVLAHADLRGARMMKAQLAGANLGRAMLGKAVLEGVDLKDTILWGTDFRGAILKRARLDGAMLTEALLAEADLSAASCEQTFFLTGDMRGTRFTGATLTRAVFYEIDLRGVDFGSATLDEATFLDCQLDGAKFLDAHMHKIRCMGSAGSWREVDLRGAQLVGANLRGVELSKSDFSGACLDKADLSEAKLSEARFYRAVARESMWVKADLHGAFMVSADLLRANLQKADLRGVDFHGANLYGADFALVRSDSRTNVTDANQRKVRTLPKRSAS